VRGQPVSSRLRYGTPLLEICYCLWISGDSFFSDIDIAQFRLGKQTLNSLDIVILPVLVEQLISVTFVLQHSLVSTLLTLNAFSNASTERKNTHSSRMIILHLLGFL
jgi:hypothetical protein